MEDHEFANIEVSVTDEEQDTLVDLFIRRVMTPESVSVFDAELAAGSSVEHALYRASFNEMVICVLAEQIERSKATDSQAD